MIGGCNLKMAAGIDLISQHENGEELLSVVRACMSPPFSRVSMMP